MFRPFIGEVLVGSICKSTPHGLWLSVGFFNDTFIPPHFMLARTLFIHRAMHFSVPVPYSRTAHPSGSITGSTGGKQTHLTPPLSDAWLQDGSEWDPNQRLWVWKSQHGDAALDPELGSKVRFRITNSVFRSLPQPLFETRVRAVSTFVQFFSIRQGLLETCRIEADATRSRGE